MRRARMSFDDEEKVLINDLRQTLFSVAKANARAHNRQIDREEWAYLCAARAVSPTAHIPISHTGEEEEDSPFITLESKSNEESAIIFKDMVAHLSKDARQIVQLILDTPEEVAGLIGTMKSGEITARSLVLFLHEYWAWGKKRIDRAFWDIREMLHA